MSQHGLGYRALHCISNKSSSAVMNFNMNIAIHVSSQMATGQTLMLKVKCHYWSDSCSQVQRPGRGRQEYMMDNRLCGTETMLVNVDLVCFSFGRACTRIAHSQYH